jgi:hypothetical protein
MFWDKKEKKSLPDLPPPRAPSLATFPRDDEYDIAEDERHELPSFPDSMNDKGFSQAAIKDAVQNERRDDFSNAGGGRTMEMQEWSPSKSVEGVQPSQSPVLPVHQADEMEGFHSSIAGPPNLEATGLNVQPRKNKDIFVKLDKFYSARKSLADAQSKLDDIDELLRRIRETKAREEQELHGWEKELLTIKSRMNDVTVNLFEKVD